jgi:hypothetical protein
MTTCRDSDDSPDNNALTVDQRESVIEREVLRLAEQAAKDTAPELPAGRGDSGEAKEG